jgi:hypothetical protein
MSKKEKLKRRLAAKPKDFSYAELKTLLVGLGYSEDHKGKTSGSRVVFIRSENGHLISLHKPHPGNILKTYQINQLIDELKKEGLI